MPIKTILNVCDSKIATTQVFTDMSYVCFLGYNFIHHYTQKFHFTTWWQVIYWYLSFQVKREFVNNFLTFKIRLLELRQLLNWLTALIHSLWDYNDKFLWIWPTVIKTKWKYLFSLKKLLAVIFNFIHIHWSVSG